MVAERSRTQILSSSDSWWCALLASLCVVVKTGGGDRLKSLIDTSNNPPYPKRLVVVRVVRTPCMEPFAKDVVLYVRFLYRNGSWQQYHSSGQQHPSQANQVTFRTTTSQVFDSHENQQHNGAPALCDISSESSFKRAFT